MKLYVENREKRMNEALFRHMACLLIDRFKETDEENLRQLALIRDFKTRGVKIHDVDGVEVIVDSREEYGLNGLKITAVDSAYQLETDLMEIHTWDTIWSWLQVASPVRALTEVIVEEAEDED